jgi:hypothetical protein
MVYVRASESAPAADGAFVLSTYGAISQNGAGEAHGSGLGFDASLVVPVAGENRPVSTVELGVVKF